MRTTRQAYEELTPVRRRALIRHAHRASRIVSQRRANLVIESAAPDGGGCLGFGVGRRGAGLEDEGWDDAVERRVCVCAGRAEREEVLGRLGHRFAEYFDFDVTVGGVKLFGSAISIAGGRRPI